MEVLPFFSYPGMYHFHGLSSTSMSIAYYFHPLNKRLEGFEKGIGLVLSKQIQQLLFGK
jgi:hypothetical protein